MITSFYCRLRRTPGAPGRYSVEERVYDSQRNVVEWRPVAAGLSSQGAQQVSRERGEARRRMMQGRGV